MKLKSIAVLVATVLTIGLFVTALKISPVRAPSPLWKVPADGTLAAVIAGALPGDQIQVATGWVEPPLAGNLVINQNNLWIIGQEVGTTPKVDVNGFSISIQANGVFIWGLNIVNTGGPSTALHIVPGVTGAVIMNNTITGNFAPNFVGITVDNAANNLIANNTMSFWDSCIVVQGAGSSGNRIALNTLNGPFNKGIWLSSFTGPPNSNSIYWNNLMFFQELFDDPGNPPNFFDDQFPGGPNGGLGWGKGNYLSVSRPGGGPPYLVPPNNAFLDNHPLSAPISQIRGDINLDGHVDILDAIILANNWLHGWGQYNWNPRADINFDGAVNILDAIILANNWLRHY